MEGGTRLKPGHGLALLPPPAAAPLLAFLRVHLATSAVGLEDEAATEMAIDGAKAGGFVPGKIFLDLPGRVAHMPEGRLCLIEGTDAKRGAMELRVFTFGCPQGRVTVSGYSPARAGSIESWRACRQALEVLVDRLQVGK